VPHRIDLHPLLAALVLPVLLLGACTASEARPPTGGPIRITTTVGMVTDIVRAVAGEHATVEGIMAEGVDPHLYKPTRADVVKLSNADIVFYNGLMLEGRMADVLVSVARDGRPVHAVTELLATGDYVMTDDEQHDDPHVWMDVGAWMRAVQAVTVALGEFDPPHADEYANNAARYLAELGRLDAYARESIASIPAEKRVLITAHDAFGYFGRAYGIEVRGIQGISTESEAGVRDIEALVTDLSDRGIPAVFVETSVAEKNVRALVEGARAIGHDVKIGGSLFSDAMGRPGTYEGTYVGMIDHNVTTITRALGGVAPEKGMNGKLDATTE
jgi:manganese/zinc/iron transport system substrate-binding protein